MTKDFWKDYVPEPSKPAPVQSCYCPNCEAMGKELAALKAQPAPVQEPVAHQVIAGALFDFMGWLTSRNERLVLSSADHAGPAVEVITEFAKMRGLSLDGARVQDWQDTTPPAQPSVPDAIHHTDLSEHPQYIQGWNDCRAEMLKGMK
jgi:hypothetical protein